MIHTFMLMLSLVAACMIRWCWQPEPTHPHRWQSTLMAFGAPPLLLLTTAISLLWMGPQGQMVHSWLGWIGQVWAMLFSGVGVGIAVTLGWQGWRSLQQVRHYPLIAVHQSQARLLPTSAPFIAQIGFWQPELVVSQGLGQLLDAEHLQAVLLHEQAHFHYRDTFWGFWLGWLRRLTAWLPRTELLWQELLLLRELRADLWAAQQSDPLLLAEALLTVVSMPVTPEMGTALKPEAVNQRLAQRIETLLEPPNDMPMDRWRWVNVVWVLLPLLVIPFHY
jgi:hypothetical protein